MSSLKSLKVKLFTHPKHPFGNITIKTEGVDIARLVQKLSDEAGTDATFSVFNRRNREPIDRSGAGASCDNPTPEAPTPEIPLPEFKSQVTTLLKKAGEAGIAGETFAKVWFDEYNTNLKKLYKQHGFEKLKDLLQLIEGATCKKAASGPNVTWTLDASC